MRAEQGSVSREVFTDQRQRLPRTLRKARRLWRLPPVGIHSHPVPSGIDSCKPRPHSQSSPIRLHSRSDSCLYYYMRNVLQRPSPIKDGARGVEKPEEEEEEEGVGNARQGTPTQQAQTTSKQCGEPDSAQKIVYFIFNHFVAFAL